MNRTRKIVVTGLMICLHIILSRFLSISTPVVKIGFSFIPIAMVAVLYGPLYAGISAAAADILGATLFPVSSFFPGFTLTAFLSGVVYGFFLYGKQRKLWRIILANVIINVCLNVFLNTYWIHLMGNSNFWALLPVRIPQNLIMIPIKVVVIWFGVYKLQDLYMMIIPAK